MNTSTNGINLIKQLEGEKLTAYRDSKGVWTIGVGHTRTAKAGMEITTQESSRLLKADLKDAENAVNRLVKLTLNQNQFDALVSLVFNIGSGNFQKSTLLRKLNVKDLRGASLQFATWNKIRLNGKLIPLKGLTRRREVERQLFVS